jgi:hypothetical protein
MNMIASGPINNSKQHFECLRCGRTDILRIEELMSVPPERSGPMPISGSALHTASSRKKDDASDYAIRARKYRDRAEECRQLADYASSEGARDNYLSMASNYDRMAEDVTVLGSLAKPSDRELG